MASESKLEVVPIGRIVQGIARPNGPRSRVRNLEAQQAVIEIDPDWASALNGIEGFSHIWVLWWLDQAPSGEDLDALEVRPEGREEMPLRGIFATRSPHRPNPIALTPVRLLERRGTRLHVQGLDAFEGTPILDLKPYLRRGDLIPEATTPAWLEQLWQLHDSES
jgi:tRNA-Thr(GGU) m(6)t(6)A37 methyltransferase TsaA